MSSYITDVGSLLNQTNGTSDLAEKLKQKKDPTSLDMTDFLTLMVVQLQNQSIDNTMDTSDMLNRWLRCR